MDWHGMPIIITLLFMVLDIVSGTIKAAVTHELSSKAAREGIWHKASYVLVIMLAMLIEYGMSYAQSDGFDLGFSVPLVVPACVMICLTETMSVIENVGEINPQLKGTKLLDLFNKHRKDGE